MSLVEQTRDVLEHAERVFAKTDRHAEIARLRARLDEPLRVAIAGKVKAGKSTLLNALVGELLAPTDTGECTKVVTWYRNGHTYQVLLYPADGSAPVQARFGRDDGAIDIDLGGRDATHVDRLDVTWPSGGLRQLTLVDTPGVGSLTDGVATRAFEFLDPDDAETPADAVLYLMKHIHASDLRLLEAFHDDSVANPNPVNAIAVLSRADEIGAGRPDSMESAARIADRLGEDGRLRRLVQMIVPVAGLLAETAETLTEGEFRELQQLAQGSGDLDLLMLSADRFVDGRPETPLTSIDRQRLLDRFGLFGVRAALELIGSERAATSSALASQLVAMSGLDRLRSVLTSLFVDRADILKARSGLLATERLCTELPMHPGVDALAADVERVMAGAHAFEEMNTLAALRSGWVSGPSRQLLDLERLLGASGTAGWQRLGLEMPSEPDVMRTAAVEQLARWQRLAENPLTAHDTATAIRVGIRSLEGLIAHSV
ncbi:MAG: dynamin family protein [Ilumatobacter sp.]